MKTIHDAVSAFEDLQEDGELQLSRHAAKRSKKRQLPKSFLITALRQQELVGAVVQPPENRFKLWVPMPDDAPMDYSDDKDLVLVIAETELDKTYNLITTFPAARSERFHDD